jgi:uncharacterized protein (TIGR03545 family)
MKKTEKKPSGAKPPKPHALYRKPVKAGRFEKRYLKAIELDADKSLLSNSFELRDGAYRLRDGLSAAELKRLNALAPFIKANAGFVKGPPLVAFGLLVFGAAAFGTVGMNPLLERGVELGLEAVFGARVELDGFKFSPFGMRAGADALRIADAASPMTNLLELGRMELRLNPAAAFRGKLYIEELSAASIATGTLRTESGALPERPTPEPKLRRERPETPPLVDFERFDAAALLEAERAKLASTAAYAEAEAAYAAAVARWNGRRASSEAAITEAKDSYASLVALDVAAIRSADQATKALGELRSAVSAAQSLRAEADGLVKDISDDKAKLDGLVRAARLAVDRDLAYLKAFVNPKSGVATAALEPALRATLSDAAERYLELGAKALAAATALATPPAERAAKPDRRGRVVRYAGERYPAFRLGLLSASFKDQGGSWAFELREVSSDPSLVRAPTSLVVRGASEDGVAAELNAEAYLDRSDPRSFKARAELAGLPVALRDELSAVGLTGLHGTASGALHLEGDKDGAVRGGLTIDLSRPAVAQASGTIGKAVTEALAAAGAVKLSADWESGGAGPERFAFATDLDRLVEDAVRRIAEAYARQATAAVEAELRRYVSEELAGKLASADEFEALLAAAKGDQAAADALQKSLDAKRRAVEDRVRALAAAATAEAQKAAQDALRGVTLPSIPRVGP